MKQVTWTQFLCVLAVAIAMYYGLLYFLKKRRKNGSAAFHAPNWGIQHPNGFPSTHDGIIEQKKALPELLKNGAASITSARIGAVNSAINITYAAAGSAVDSILAPDGVSEEGIDLESLISTFELASKSTVTLQEKESLGQTAAALYDDVYFQQLLTGNETIRQKVEWALLRPDSNGPQPGRLMYHTEEAVA